MLRHTTARHPQASCWPTALAGKVLSECQGDQPPQTPRLLGAPVLSGYLDHTPFAGRLAQAKQLGQQSWAPSVGDRGGGG